MPLPKIYLAGPLFSLAERDFNLRLASELERYGAYELILPQRKGDEIAGAPDFASKMYKYCLEMVELCDCVVAILDGADADSGTCIEVGFAAAIEKPVIGVRTDFRESEDQGTNLMVSGSCTELIRKPYASIEEMAVAIHASLQKVVGMP